MKEYLIRLYNTRFFWIRLARNQLQANFRRSKLGGLWLIVQPFMMSLIMSLVFSLIWRSDLGDSILYILSGMIVWDFIQPCFVTGASAFIESEQYIKQYNHPLTVYSLKSCLYIAIVFSIEMISLFIWMVYKAPQNILLGLLTFPLTLVLFMGSGWMAITISAYLGTKFRDYSKIMVLVMQTVWYISPVFFSEEIFLTNEKYAWILHVNPIYYYLNLIRKPFLHGMLPSVTDFVWVISVMLILSIVAYRVNKKNSRTLIFYI